jgi:CheY-like chemotaxis protein
MNSPSPDKHILLVDDDENTRLAVGDMLEWMGYRVTVAASGPEALDYLEHDRFDGVLLDLIMPGMNGRDVLREIRARGYTMPVIIVSGYRDLASDMQREGAQAFLLKPFPQHSLRELLALHIGLPTEKM